MITRSNLADQLKEYQIPCKNEWPATSFSSSASASNSSSRVDVIFVIWEILMFACLVFTGVSLYFRSSSNMLVLRNANRTRNLFPSGEYTTKWPLSATNVLLTVTSGEASLVVHKNLFLHKAAISCHFLAISRDLFWLSMAC